ncbi:UDP-N-acetylmuramate--L-alanine ligase [Saxibacter everestensis]|uniref:UDP-N-acetylmuramate--L-alanine ligase n=1 Tax=Saxibacter everestensis TaxID=2909229 RepID=A0ABY8R0R9_9MICO|nr:UDP-N-acetylmuramate--L-alanine ligase [Brevibacteriaceae bacterium ZFBP1038]
MVSPEESPVIPATELGRVFFVGIGGAGMSGIARVMLMRGMDVAGSDARDSRVLTLLRAQGAEVFVGHDASHLRDVDTLVVSSAVRDSNAELVAARASGLRILHRSQALAALMVDRRAVAIAGTHGKTTTTSMTTVALQHCGIDPSFAIGGILTATGANAHDGTGDVFVAEADESDGSFLLYTPRVGVITNVEADHLDFYGTGEAVEKAFDQFCDRVGESSDGVVVACADDAGAARVAERARQRGVTVWTYGRSDTADFRLENADFSGPGAVFDLVAQGRRLGRVALRQPGEYNALNAAAAFAVTQALGQPVDRALAGLKAFGGTRRRFELRGEVNGVRVFDDYAHHPTELNALLKAARGVVAGSGRVFAIFQPHLFSRTVNFQVEFAQALGRADEVVVMDVYAAREDPVPGVSGAIVADRVELDPGLVHFIESWSAVVPFVLPKLQPNDIVLTIGAGDVTMLGPEILEGLTS